MYRSYLEDIKNKYNQRLGAKQELEQNIAQTEENIQHLKSSVTASTQAIELMSQVSLTAREQAKQHLEMIVTEALKFISNDEYRFVIELGETGGKPSCEFFVESEVNGIVSRQKPESACGGGFVDIISTTLRYAYLEIFSDPVLKNRVMILDEPGKMISEQASARFSEFIKYLGENFDRQTIMITHNENLMNSADKTLFVSNYQGVSKVIEMEAEE